MKIQNYNKENMNKSFKKNRIKLSKLQEDIITAIETLNYSLFVDLGCTTIVDLNFMFSSGGNLMYPIMSAAAKGSQEMLDLVLLNKTVNIHVKNDNGVNSYWIGCMYGHGQILKILAERGIDIFCFNQNKINCMHLAVTKNYPHIVEMLLESDFPLDMETLDGMTAL